MKAPKSMTGIFSELARNRQDARNAVKRFVVVMVKKDGTPYKVMPQDITSCGTVTHEQAITRQKELERMNPTRCFTIVAL